MLKDGITEIEIKKIFSNTALKTEYLSILFSTTNSNNSVEKTIAKINKQIIDTWEYNTSKTILREMYKRSDKYIKCRQCGNQIQEAIQNWDDNNIGEFSWPFSAMLFDQRAHQINRMDISEEDKDKLLASEVKRFRRIKDINAKRNDYIEYLIFEYNENVIPTFTNSKGVDYYINGEPYDQKTSKSVGANYIQRYGDNYREIAINNPELVAESLYEFQDESRFGDEARVLVIYLDQNVSAERTKEIILSTHFEAPINFSFEYHHSGNRVQRHNTSCFVVLIRN